MATGDGGRGGRHLGKRAFDKIKDENKIVDERLGERANLEVGDFVSELVTAIRYREKHGLLGGDWVDEPERIYTDRRVFAEEVASPSDVKLQITLSLDASRSMWRTGIMAIAGRAFVALDKVIRRAQGDLPEGSVLYQPFAFNDAGYKLDSDNLTDHFEGERSIPGFATGWAAHHTRVSALLARIEKWEAENDPDAHRLDIIITDGAMDERGDREEANKIQERRNGRLTTVLLNFLPPSKWGAFKLPDRCYQYAVTGATLSGRLRQIVTEQIGALL